MTNALNAQPRPSPTNQSPIFIVATNEAKGQAPPAATLKEDKVAASLTKAPVDRNIYPRPALDDFEAQVVLARQLFSPGPLDGITGSQTRAALSTFQETHGLSVSGVVDDLTRDRLLLSEPPLMTRAIVASDFDKLQPLSRSWLGKSQQSALGYETLLEWIAEQHQAHPEFIRKLNPAIDWGRIAPGVHVRVPAVEWLTPTAKGAYLRIILERRLLRGFDPQDNLVCQFPCSIARRVEKRPLGELRIQVVIPDPNYTFDPDVFPESEEGRRLGRKLVLPPGPNNPVGVAWIGLDRPGYGIHGTPRPEEVGRTESHGCFRLANWNAAFLLNFVWVGMPVRVE